MFKSISDPSSNHLTLFHLNVDQLGPVIGDSPRIIIWQRRATALAAQLHRLN